MEHTGIRFGSMLLSHPARPVNGRYMCTSAKDGRICLQADAIYIPGWAGHHENRPDRLHGKDFCRPNRCNLISKLKHQHTSLIKVRQWQPDMGAIQGPALASERYSAVCDVTRNDA